MFKNKLNYSSNGSCFTDTFLFCVLICLSQNLPKSHHSAAQRRRNEIFAWLTQILSFPSPFSGVFSLPLALYTATVSGALKEAPLQRLSIRFCASSRRNGHSNFRSLDSSLVTTYYARCILLRSFAACPPRFRPSNASPQDIKTQ